MAEPAVRPDAECRPGGHRLAAVAAACAGAGGRWRSAADELTQAVARIASITAMILFAGGMTVLSAGTDHSQVEAAMLVLQGGSLPHGG